MINLNRATSCAWSCSPPPADAAAGASARPRVGIVGGGMAGVALAWLSTATTTSLCSKRAGRSAQRPQRTLDVDGVPLVIDVGAQYFIPVLSSLCGAPGAARSVRPGGCANGAAHSFPASITLFSDDEATPRFCRPCCRRGWPLLVPWNRSGVQAFSTAFHAAKRRERQREDWVVTLQDWLPTLGCRRRSGKG